MPSDSINSGKAEDGLKTPTVIAVCNSIDEAWRPSLPDPCQRALAAACDALKDAKIGEDGNIVEPQTGPELEACLRRLFRGFKGGESQPETTNKGNVIPASPLDDVNVTGMFTAFKDKEPDGHSQ